MIAADVGRCSAAFEAWLPQLAVTSARANQPARPGDLSEAAVASLVQ